jgi:hypothetical protein
VLVDHAATVVTAAVLCKELHSYAVSAFSHICRDVRAYRRILYGSIKYGINTRITYTTPQYTDNWRILLYVALYAVYEYKYAYSHTRLGL